MRLAVLAFARQTFDVAFAGEMAVAAAAALQAAGAQLHGDATLLMDADALATRLDELGAAPVDGVIVLQASFCDAEMIKRVAAVFDVPIAIWAFPEPRTGGRLRLNSFCGLNLAAHALGLLGRSCAYVYGAPDELPPLDRLLEAPPPGVHTAASDPDPAAAERALRATSGAFGLVGEHPAGFDTCRYDADVLARLFGVRVAPMTLPALFDAARAASGARVRTLHAETRDRLAGVDELEPEPLEKSLRLYAALSDAVAMHELKGVAVRCWPETFTDYGCAVCGAMARLDDEGTPAACEADMLGAVGSRLLQELAGAPAMLADVVDMDAANDTTVLWHCGLAPLSMRDPASPAEATIHSNRQKPLLNQFALRPGRVTLMRLSQAKGTFQLVVGSGTMIRAPRPFSGTCGTLVLDGGTERCRDVLVAEGLEHHVSFAYGDLKPGLLSIAARLALPVLDLDAHR